MYIKIFEDVFKNYDNVEILERDMRLTHFENEKMDLIISNQVFGTRRSPLDERASLAEE